MGSLHMYKYAYLIIDAMAGMGLELSDNRCIGGDLMLVLGISQIKPNNSGAGT